MVEQPLLLLLLQDLRHPESLLYLAEAIPPQMGGGGDLARNTEEAILPTLRLLSLHGGPLQLNEGPDRFELVIYDGQVSKKKTPIKWSTKGPGKDMLAWRSALSALLCGDFGATQPDAWFPSDGALRVRQLAPESASYPYEINVPRSRVPSCALSSRQMWDIVACLDALAQLQIYLFPPLPELRVATYRPVDFGFSTFLAALNPWR